MVTPTPLITAETYDNRQSVCDQLCQVLPTSNPPDLFDFVAPQLLPEAYPEVLQPPEPLSTEQILFIARTIVELGETDRIPDGSAALCIELLRHNYPDKLRELRRPARRLRPVAFPRPA